MKIREMKSLIVVGLLLMNYTLCAQSSGLKHFADSIRQV